MLQDEGAASSAGCIFGPALTSVAARRAGPQGLLFLPVMWAAWKMLEPSDFPHKQSTVTHARVPGSNSKGRGQGVKAGECGSRGGLLPAPDPLLLQCWGPFRRRGQVEGPGAREAAWTACQNTRTRSRLCSDALGHRPRRRPHSDGRGWGAAPSPAVRLQSRQSPRTGRRRGGGEGGQLVCPSWRQTRCQVPPRGAQVSACAKHFVIIQHLSRGTVGVQGGCEPEMVQGQARGGGRHRLAGLQPAGLRDLLPVCVRGMGRRGCWLQAGLGWAPRPTAWETHELAQGWPHVASEETTPPDPALGNRPQAVVLLPVLVRPALGTSSPASSPCRTGSDPLQPSWGLPRPQWRRRLVSTGPASPGGSRAALPQGAWGTGPDPSAPSPPPCSQGLCLLPRPHPGIKRCLLSETPLHPSSQPSGCPGGSQGRRSRRVDMGLQFGWARG